LEKEKWLESRRGSGVFVRSEKPDGRGDAPLAMDKLIAGLFRTARDAGMPLTDLRRRLRHWLAMQPPDHFLLIEPDEELREIVMAEMRAGVKFAIRGCTIEDCAKPENLTGAAPVVLPSKADKVRKALPESSECVVLQLRSVTSSLAGAPGVKPELLVGVASRWPGFLRLARTMLVAAGFHADSLVLRDVRKAGWEKPLLQTDGVVCDALTAQRLPKACRAFPFSLISEASLNELRRYEEFISQPLN
jgi:GntR family transcriptional regulator